MTNLVEHRNWLKRCLTVVPVLLVASGCSTPQPAKDLALQGAVTADKAQVQLSSFVDRADHAYKRREAVLRELAEGEIQDVSAGDFRAWIDDQAGVSSNKDGIALISRIAERSRTVREERNAAFAAKSQQISEAAGPAIATSNANLANAKKAFLVLAQELTPAEWVAFSQSFLQQIKSDLKALDKKADSDAAAK